MRFSTNQERATSSAALLSCYWWRKVCPTVASAAQTIFGLKMLKWVSSLISNNFNHKLVSSLMSSNLKHKLVSSLISSNFKHKLVSSSISSNFKHKSSDRGSDRRPNLAKEAELPQESYISRKRVGHFHNFLMHGSNPYILIFLLSLQ